MTPPLLFAVLVCAAVLTVALVAAIGAIVRRVREAAAPRFSRVVFPGER